MKCPFCYLEKDEKTFDYVKHYLQVMKNGESTTPLDITIQRLEIEHHLNANGISHTDRKAISEWIENNSANFRIYLNSLKMVALFIYYVKKAEHLAEENQISFDLFTEAVAYWNERKIEVADSIFI